MKTIVIEIARDGSTIDLILKRNAQSGQVVLVLSDDVEIKPQSQASAGSGNGFRTFVSENGFPPINWSSRQYTRYCESAAVQSRFGTLTGISMTKPQSGLAFQLMHERGLLRAANLPGGRG